MAPGLKNKAMEAVSMASIGRVSADFLLNLPGHPGEGCNGSGPPRSAVAVGHRRRTYKVRRRSCLSNIVY